MNSSRNIAAANTARTLYGSRPSEVDLQRRTVSVMAACRLVGVSRRTLYNWMNTNKVEYIYTAGGSRRIFEDTLWRERMED